MKQDKLKDRQSQAQFIVTGRHALIKAQEAQSSKDEERTRTGTSKRNYIYYIVGVEEWHGLREKESQRSEKHTILGARTESSLGPSEGLDVTSSLFCFLDGPRVKA
ncbi:hypothetical protein V6N12_076031 [Hibiscus sabdariffa]|uniref:Uncharacterized protein n=1 Tax=Hibiscus sabdariffa TaxID=183260 RepID=A0ABR2AY24_9ROSI